MLKLLNNNIYLIRRDYILLNINFNKRKFNKRIFFLHYNINKRRFNTRMYSILNGKKFIYPYIKASYIFSTIDANTIYINKLIVFAVETNEILGVILVILSISMFWYTYYNGPYGIDPKDPNKKAKKLALRIGSIIFMTIGAVIITGEISDETIRELTEENVILQVDNESLRKGNRDLVEPWLNNNEIANSADKKNE